MLFDGMRQCIAICLSVVALRAQEARFHFNDSRFGEIVEGDAQRAVIAAVKSFHGNDYVLRMGDNADSLSAADWRSFVLRYYQTVFGANVLVSPASYDVLPSTVASAIPCEWEVGSPESLLLLEFCYFSAWFANNGSDISGAERPISDHGMRNAVVSKFVKCLRGFGDESAAARLLKPSMIIGGPPLPMQDILDQLSEDDSAVLQQLEGGFAKEQIIAGFVDKTFVADAEAFLIRSLLNRFEFTDEQLRQFIDVCPWWQYARVGALLIRKQDVRFEWVLDKCLAIAEQEGNYRAIMEGERIVLASLTITKDPLSDIFQCAWNWKKRVRADEWVNYRFADHMRAQLQSGTPSVVDLQFKSYLLELAAYTGRLRSGRYKSFWIQAMPWWEQHGDWLKSQVDSALPFLGEDAQKEREYLFRKIDERLSVMRKLAE